MINISGLDQKGVSAALFAAIPPSIAVKDVEQVVIAGILQLSVLLEVTEEIDVVELESIVEAAVTPLGMQVSFVQSNQEETISEHRLKVTVLSAPLTADNLGLLAEAIAAAGANIDRIERIASYPVTALELSVSGVELLPLRSELSSLAAQSKLDIAVQDGGINRRGRQLIVMDVDSTVIQDEVVELLAKHAGVEDEVKRVTDAAMAGELDFEQSLRHRVRLLKGLPETIFETVYKELRLTPGARTLCRVLSNLDYHIALVSGGFTQVVEPLGQDLGVHHIKANVLEVVDGKLTGEVLGEVVDRAGKAAALRAFAKEHGIPLHRTIAIGDGANDLDMLATAGLGIAFNAKPVVRNAADAAVNVPYLDSVLYFLGITRGEIEVFDAQSGRAAEYPPVNGHSHH